MGADLNYPDNLYAEHLAKQTPTGAYRSTEVVSDTEAKLRTALAYVNHVRDLITSALDQPTGCNAPIQPARQTAKQAYDEQTRRDVAWSVHRGDYDLPPSLAVAVTAPNCDGYAYLPDIGIGDVEPRHPMQAEADRLIGPEDVL